MSLLRNRCQMHMIGHQTVGLHPDAFYRRYRTYRFLLRGRQVRWRQGEGGHGGRHVRRGDGAEEAYTRKPDCVSAWRRANRYGLAADARWAARLGVLLREARLRC